MKKYYFMMLLLAILGIFVVSVLFYRARELDMILKKEDEIQIRGG